MSLFAGLFSAPVTKKGKTASGGLFAESSQYVKKDVDPSDKQQHVNVTTEAADKHKEGKKRKAEVDVIASAEDQPAVSKKNRDAKKAKSAPEPAQQPEQSLKSKRQKGENKGAENGAQAVHAHGKHAGKPGKSKPQPVASKKGKQPPKKEDSKDEDEDEEMPAVNSEDLSDLNSDELEELMGAGGSEGSDEDAEGEEEGEEEEEEEEGAEEKAQQQAPDARKPKKSEEEHAEQLTRTLFVGNLPAKTKVKEVKSHFARYGKVVSVRLRSVPLDMEAKMPRRAAILTGKVDGRAPATAYVVFATREEAVKALAANMTELGGHHLRVNPAAAPSKKRADGGAASAPGADGSGEFDPQRSLFIGNLHFQTTDEELIQFFTGPEALKGNPELQPTDGVSALEAVRVVRDPATSIGKGFAFALFRTKAAARAGVSLNGKELRKRQLRVMRVSVQQQQKVRMAKAMATPGTRPGQSPGARAGPKGGAGGRVQGAGGPGGKGGPGGDRRGPRAGPGGVGGKPGRGAAQVGLVGDGSWQGTKTKGKGGGVRGGKVAAQAAPGSGKAGASPAGRTRDGKRPAVAMRKAKKLAQGGGGGGGGGGPVGGPRKPAPNKGPKPGGKPKGGFKGKK